MDFDLLVSTKIQEIPVSYNLGLIFVVLDILHLSNHNIVVNKVIASVWECGNAAWKKSNGAKNTTSQIIEQVLS